MACHELRRINSRKRRHTYCCPACMLTALVRKKIWLVDDDRDASELIAHVLRVDYEVLLARDGIEGVEQAAKEHPALVITDVDMPRLGGFAMVR
jgi:CheY-like chemotaxis protein